MYGITAIKRRQHNLSSFNIYSEASTNVLSKIIKSRALLMKSYFVLYRLITESEECEVWCIRPLLLYRAWIQILHGHPILTDALILVCKQGRIFYLFFFGGEFDLNRPYIRVPRDMTLAP